jgi:hypothetical protein
VQTLRGANSSLSQGLWICWMEKQPPILIALYLYTFRGKSLHIRDTMLTSAPSSLSYMLKRHYQCNISSEYMHASSRIKSCPKALSIVQCQLKGYIYVFFLQLLHLCDMGFSMIARTNSISCYPLKMYCWSGTSVANGNTLACSYLLYIDTVLPCPCVITTRCSRQQK